VVSFLLNFPTKSYIQSSSPHACYIPFPSHPPWLDNSNYVCEEYKLWISSLCSFLQSPVTSSLFVQIFSSAPCSQTPSVYVPPLLSETKCHTIQNQWQDYSFVYSNSYALRLR
jgi:hypothetical protein